MVIIVMMTVMNIIPNSKVHGANMGPSGADRTQVGPMLATWTLPTGIAMTIEPKREKEESEYFNFVKIAWMAPGY